MGTDPLVMGGEDPGDEVVALVRTLLETQRRLQEITGGELDAVGHPGGQYFLLHSAQEKLRESEERFFGAFEHAAIGMALVSPEGRWLKANRALCELLGYSESALLQRTFQEITHPEDLETDLGYVRSVLAGEIPSYQMEKRYFHADGHIVTVLLSVSLVHDGLGQPLYFISQIQDITRSKAAEAEVRFNEQRYRSLVEATSAIVWDTPPSGEFEVAQPRWSDFTGQTFEELRGWGWLDAIHPGDRVETRRVWAEAVASRSSYKVEHRLRTREHAYRHMAVCAVPVMAADGGIVQWIGIHRDITERKRAEAAVIESQQRLALATKSAHIGIWDWDVVANRLVWDAQMYALYGIREQDFGGAYEAWRQGLHPDDQLRAEAAIQAALTGAKDFDIEFRVVWPGGAVHHIEAHAVVQRGASGAATRMVGVNWDITARKHAEAELEETHRELLVASRQAGMAEVATGVLHNVGNVLNSVNVASSCVADSVKKSKAADLSKVVAMLRQHEADLGNFFTQDPKGRQIPGYLALLADRLSGEQSTVLKELAELQRNIEHIREIVTMQQSSAKKSGLKEVIDVTALMEDAVKMDAVSLARQDVTVIRDFGDTPPVSVDKHRVLQILLNLVRNARQACETSTAPRRQITIRTRNSGGSVRIAISDNGTGILPENLPRIFGHGFTTKKDGHGFGLHSAAAAAGEMGGRLSVDSEGLGQGATFTLELPCGSPDAGSSGETEASPG